jgi:hypothetical protein
MIFSCKHQDHHNDHLIPNLECHAGSYLQVEYEHSVSDGMPAISNHALQMETSRICHYESGRKESVGACHTLNINDVPIFNTPARL